jgi:hypothetical protein
MDFTEFAAWMSGHVEAHESGDPEALTRALAPFADTGAACALLRSVLRDERWLSGVQRNSYRHPNGFDKMVLLSDQRFQVRLHMWKTPHSPEDGIENVHNHRWDFASIMLLGGYRYQEFVLADDEGGSFHAYSYGYSRGSPTYSLTSLGLRSLACSLDAHLGTGASYALGTGVFHRVMGDPGRTTATLVLQGARRATSVLVFAEDPRPVGRALALTGFSHTSLLHDLRALLRELEHIR